MKNGFWVKRAWQVWTVATTNNVDIGVGFDMFKTDVWYGEAHTYNTGDALPGYDWKAEQAEWQKVAIHDQITTYAEWHEFQGLYYALLCRAWTAGDRDKFESYVAAYLAD